MDLNRASFGKPEMVDRLRSAMRDRPEQAISFYTFMEICLYADKVGYYSSDTVKIGREGDFYTSSSIGTIMGECLADYIAQAWGEYYAKRMPFTIVEWGGGNGRLAKQILDRLADHCPSLYEGTAYIMIERSPYHRKLQREELRNHRNKLRWMDEDELWQEGRLHDAIILANELLDAFPVLRIRQHRGVREENWVRWNETTGCFEEMWLPIANAEPEAYLNGLALREGQIAEWNPVAAKWVERMANQVERGEMLVIDYGAESTELYAEHRMAGTLMCYRRHQAHDNPYIHVGEQDITAHVDFTSCMQAARRTGCTQVSLRTQRQFLVEQGILNKLQAAPWGDPFSAEAKLNRAIRQIVLSDGMSELFKVMIARK